VTSVPIDRVIEEVHRTLRRGDIVRTVGMVRELARQARQDPRSRYLQALTAIEFTQAREAVGLLETLIFELTGEPLRDATLALARARELQGDYENALTTIRPELESDNPPPAAIATAARVRFSMGDAHGALALLDGAAVDEKHRHEIARARAFIALGTPADDPARDARETASLEALQAEADHVGVPGAALMPLLLDLGELLARRGEDAAAARAWKRSASLSPNKLDPRTYAQSVMALANTWNDKAIARARVNDDPATAASERPIFVVGMPGGGAQFAADLLAASPEVARTADQEALTAAMGRHIPPAKDAKQQGVPDPARLTGKQLSETAAAYLERTRPADGEPARVVDAFELNLHSLGIVAQLFPKASVVFVTRTPFDACLACMLAHRDPRLLYANDPQGIAVFAGGIARLAERWQQVFAGDHLPLRHAVVDHDTLATDPAARRALFESLGLTPPPDADLERIAADKRRSTRYATGLADRFARHLPQLEDAAGRIGLERI
jgi:hypothetical protein